MNGDDYDAYETNEDEDFNIEKTFSFTHVTFEDVCERIDKFLHSNIGKVSVKLYQNYYDESIKTLLNCSIIISFLIINLILSRVSVFWYFISAAILLLIDDSMKLGLYRFVGKIMLKLFRYRSEYSLLEDYEKPSRMDKYDFSDFTSIDLFWRYGLTYFLTCMCLFAYPLLGKLFLYRIYEICLELLMAASDYIMIEIHFLRYIYYGIIDDTHEHVVYTDLITYAIIIIPFFMWIVEYLTIPSHIKEREFKGSVIMFGAPILLCIPFLYESDSLLAIFILYCFYVLFVLWFVAEVHEKKTEEYYSMTYGKKYKSKRNQAQSNTAENIIQQLTGGMPL